MIYIISSRMLCYESNVEFAEQMNASLRRLGKDTKLVCLTDNWENELEELDTRGVEAIIDINSLLPRMINDDDSYFLDRFDAVFYNYIVDHPMYHHPGLSAKLQKSRVLCIDRYHADYVRENYPHIERADYMPLSVSSKKNIIPFENRDNEFLIMATMINEKDILKDVERFPKQYVKHILNLQELYFDNPYTTQERIAREYFQREGLETEADSFAVFMNNVCIADKLARYRRRKVFFEALVKEGMPVTVAGDGWEEYADYSNVKHVGSIDYNMTYEIVENSKRLINLSPEFHGGVHDRVFLGMARGCAVITDAPEVLEKDNLDFESISVYDRGSVSDFLQKCAMSLDNEGYTFELAMRGYEKFNEFHTWDARMSAFLHLFCM